MPKIEFYDLIHARQIEFEERLRIDEGRGPTLKELLAFGHADLPRRGSEQAAGLDLCASEYVALQPWATTLVPTGLAINKLPDGTYARIAPRSGLAVKGLIVNAGVVDADYRGEVKVVIFNTTREPFIIEEGDRIAQLILEKIVYAEPVLVHSLDDSERGDGGFGSTGR